MGSKSMLLRAPLSLRPAKNRQVWSASFVPKWRVTADEDGHYCFAVAL